MRRWVVALAAPAAAALLIWCLPPEAVPGAAPVYLLAVVAAAFEGGFGPGLLSAALALGHSWYYRVCAPSQFHSGCFALESLVVGAPATALLVGWLRRQADKRLEALAEAKALHRRDALQRELIANVSHEFRTPIAAIKGYTETLQAGAGDEPETRGEFLAVIARHAERLSRLVESLLDLAALESVAFASPGATELDGILRESAASLEAQGARVEVRVSEGCAALVDREQLSRIVGELCGNALQHAPPGVRVALSAVQEASGSVAVRVEDDGPGIGDAQAPHLFEPFSQRKGRRRAVGGSGLGLPVAASLARANGGRLELERTGPGGSCFLLMLPAARGVTLPASHGLTLDATGGNG